MKGGQADMKMTQQGLQGFALKIMPTTTYSMRTQVDWHTVRGRRLFRRDVGI